MAVPPTSRLTRDDWIDAAVDVLLHAGPDGVAVQPLGRRLGATKGSFYWHFSSRDELLRAALEQWERAAADDLIAAVEARSDEPDAKAGALLGAITSRAEQHPGELDLLADASHPDITAAIERVTRRRIDYLARLLRAGGRTPSVAQRRAMLGYAACIGYAQLSRSVAGVLPDAGRARRALEAELIGILQAG